MVPTLRPCSLVGCQTSTGFVEELGELGNPCAEVVKCRVPSGARTGTPDVVSNSLPGRPPLLSMTPGRRWFPYTVSSGFKLCGARPPKAAERLSGNSPIGYDTISELMRNGSLDGSRSSAASQISILAPNQVMRRTSHKQMRDRCSLSALIVSVEGLLHLIRGGENSNGRPRPQCLDLVNSSVGRCAVVSLRGSPATRTGHGLGGNLPGGSYLMMIQLSKNVIPFEPGNAPRINSISRRSASRGSPSGDRRVKSNSTAFARDIVFAKPKLIQR